ncbi:MAG TPA: efflux RND transporter periplasmic adaptor subunit [Vicinamibacterales bacterium]|jgi:RND family efflux transporter MFP subunit
MIPPAARRLVPALALVGLAACGHEAVEQVETAAAVPVSVEAAKVETLESTLTVSGTVAPGPGADLLVTSPEPARIAEIPKAEGDVIRAGDLLVRFDIPSLAADVDARRAAVKQAQARLDTAKANVTRLAPLVERGVTSQRDLEDARRAETEAEADLAQAQSAVSAATALAARAVVRAPFNGVVAKRWHNPGDLVEASASDPVLRVIDPNRLQILAAVPVADLSRVTPGRKGRATGPSGDVQPVTVITRPAQIDPKTTLGDVRLAFAGRSTLPAGAAVTVEIISETRANVLVIPAVAVVREGDEAFVMVAGSDNKAHKHIVKTGLESRDRIEILSGLNAGQQVIVHGQDDLPDNAAITVSK